RRRVLALQILGELEQHVAEALDAPDRQAIRLAIELGQRVKGAEDIGRAVDKKQMHGWNPVGAMEHSRSEPPDEPFGRRTGTGASVDPGFQSPDALARASE